MWAVVSNWCSTVKSENVTSMTPYVRSIGLIKINFNIKKNSKNNFLDALGDDWCLCGTKEKKIVSEKKKKQIIRKKTNRWSMWCQCLRIAWAPFGHLKCCIPHILFSDKKQTPPVSTFLNIGEAFWCKARSSSSWKIDLNSIFQFCTAFTEVEVIFT